MFYRLVAQLRFYLTATNQHGVHSPFIFDFVTKCLYHKVFKGPKYIGVLLKSIEYFQAKSVYIDSRNIDVQKQIKTTFPNIKYNQHPYDCIFLDRPNNKVFKRMLADELFHNNTVVLVNHIYYSNQNTESWKKMKENKRVTVSVDMFYSGALFLRREQAKEHFKIRI
jgi:hypothetical protein